MEYETRSYMYIYKEYYEIQWKLKRDPTENITRLNREYHEIH